jgi:hypothetical protein
MNTFKKTEDIKKDIEFWFDKEEKGEKQTQVLVQG